MLKWFGLSLIVGHVIGGLMETSSCGGDEKIFVNVTVDACNGDVCMLHAGQVTPLIVNFIPSHDIPKGKYLSSVKALGLDIPVIRKENVCKKISNGCPILKGKLATHKCMFRVPPYAPTLLSPVPVTVRIDDENGKIVICRIIKAEILPRIKPKF